MSYKGENQDLETVHISPVDNLKEHENNKFSKIHNFNIPFFELAAKPLGSYM